MGGQEREPKHTKPDAITNPVRILRIKKTDNPWAYKETIQTTLTSTTIMLDCLIKWFNEVGRRKSYNQNSLKAKLMEQDALKPMINKAIERRKIAREKNRRAADVTNAMYRPMDPKEGNK